MAASTVRPSRGKEPREASAQSSTTDKRDGLGAESVTPERAAASLSGFNGNRRVPQPVNEPVKSYAPGSAERATLKARLQSMSNERVDIPIIIGGKEIRTGVLSQTVMPHNHRHVLADWHRASAEHVDQAISAAQAAAREWANWSWEDRASVFL
jgi:1-pyrroline-5-carboxylate dehydrogenase